MFSFQCVDIGIFYHTMLYVNISNVLSIGSRVTEFRLLLKGGMKYVLLYETKRSEVSNIYPFNSNVLYYMITIIWTLGT